MKSMKWDRLRFKANLEDYRPVKWPPLGPYWCSGESDTHAIVIAYLPHSTGGKNTMKQLKEFWPEAEEVEFTHVNTELEFSDRFQKPDWWKP